jgi:hypothetical protein
MSNAWRESLCTDAWGAAVLGTGFTGLAEGSITQSSPQLSEAARVVSAWSVSIVPPILTNEFPVRFWNGAVALVKVEHLSPMVVLRDEHGRRKQLQQRAIAKQ